MYNDCAKHGILRPAILWLFFHSARLQYGQNPIYSRTSCSTFPAPGIRQFYQGKSLGHSPSRIPRTRNNQRSVKEKGGFLHLCQKIHLFPLQTKLTPGMRCDEIFYRPPAGMPAILPLRYETAHNSFQMGRAVIPCRGQNSLQLIFGNQSAKILDILYPGIITRYKRSFPVDAEVVPITFRPFL